MKFESGDRVLLDTLTSEWIPATVIESHTPHGADQEICCYKVEFKNRNLDILQHMRVMPHRIKPLEVEQLQFGFMEEGE